MASGTCPFCQGTLSPTARFCIHCGQKLVAAPPKPAKPTEAELQKKIAAAIAEGVCTYVHTGSNFAKQKWWRCFTCSDAKKTPENWGACQVCAVQCHRDLGHSIGFGGESNFYCDCGFTGQKSGTSGLCHALSVSGTGPSAKTSPSKPTPAPAPKPSTITQPIQQASRTSFSLTQPVQPSQPSISSRTSFSLSSGSEKIILVSSKEDIKTIAKKLGIVDATPNTKPLKFEGTYLDLYRVESDDGIHMQWVVRNEQPFCPIKFSFDFTGSTGLNLHGPPKQDTIVAPGEAKKVGDIKTIDPEKGCNVSCSYSYALLAPDPVAVKAFQETKSKEKQDVVSLIKSLGFTSATPLDTMVSTVTKAGVKYYDPDFPPDPRSIRGHAKDEKGPIDEKTVVWKRPEEFLKQVNLFQGIDPTDINQGALGNCWFCCALSALAEFEHYIKRMFETKTINAAGIYRLKLYNETDVDPVVITIDDYFPCKAGPGGTGTPLFTHNKGDEIWVMLVEKAYAKMMSSYFQLRSGDPADAFSDLTGCPVDELELEDENTQKLVQSGALWNLLKECDKQKCVMAASKNGDDKFTEHGHEPENKLGLVPGHAYSLIDVKEGMGVKLVRLRNPWGRFEWKGDWSDASPLWTDEAKKVFNPVLDETDGTFYMSWNHFMANFDSIDICYAASPGGEEWNTCRVKGYISTTFPYLPTSFYELKLSKKTHGYLSIFQADERVVGASKPIDLGFAIFKGTDFKTVVSHNAVKTKNRSNIRLDLESGTYIIVPYTSGVGLARQLYFGGKREDQKETKQFLLALHTDLDDVKLTPISSDAKSLNQARIALLKTVGRQQKWDQHCIYSVTGSGLCTFAVENGGDREVDFTLDFEGSNNVLSAMGGLKVTKRVSPGEILLMQDLAPADPTKGYGFKYKSSRREV